MKEITEKKWIYYFDELSEEVQEKVIDKYFKGEIILGEEKAREYSYTEDGRIIVKE